MNAQDFGEFEIAVNRAVWQGKECYMIHVTEENIVNDVPKVTNIIGRLMTFFEMILYQLLPATT